VKPAAAHDPAQLFFENADTCTHTDSAHMWEETRAIASRILAAAPGE
jgi:hypothetical protein